ncbi:MAG: DinB family protein [Bacillaceae bacterium]|nr:DinB family protein [Bacillaceae bacterium]
MIKTLRQFEEMIPYILKLKEIPEETLSQPIKEGKWSIRQIIGHMYYWDKFNLEKMAPHMVEGSNLPAFPDHDEHNEEAMTYIKDFSTAFLIETFVQTRHELSLRLSKVEQDVRFTVGKGKRKLSAESFMKIFVKHDTHHLNQIEGKLNQE